MHRPSPATSPDRRPPRAPTERIFLALWPPPGVADVLARAAGAVTRACGGRPSRTDTLHLTLAFVGDVPHAQVDVAARLIPSMGGTAFRLVLDRIGLWRHNGVAWAAPSTLPAPLAALRREAARALDQAGIAHDRRPFRPHVTLARRVARPLPASVDLGALAWEVSEVLLVRSGRDAQGAAQYEVLATRALNGCHAPPQAEHGSIGG